MMKGYEHLGTADIRRVQYHKDCKPPLKKEIGKDRLRDLDDDSIEILAVLILEAKKSGELKKILNNASAKLTLPPPSRFMTDDGVDKLHSTIIEKSLGKQVTEALIEQTKIIPTISEGVSEANIKLDKLAKVSAQMDRFDSFVDEQTSAGLNSVVYTILGEDMLKYDSAEYEWKAQVIKAELIDHLHRTILHRLPSEALGEIEEFMDAEDPDIGQVDDFIHRNASKWGIDINTIIFDTTTRFVEFYTRRIFEGAADDIVEVPPVQPEPKKLGRISQEDIDKMNEEDVDAFIGDTLKGL